MNIYQRIIILTGTIVVATITACPPWIWVSLHPDVRSTQPAGYHLLWRKPKVSAKAIKSFGWEGWEPAQAYISSRIETTTYGMELVGVIVVTVGLALATGSRKQ